MKRLLILLVFALPLGAQSATLDKGQKDLAAILTHESHELTAEGVSKDVRYQERFIRKNGHVWAERIVPESVSAESEKHEAKDGHKHDFNFNIAAKHIIKDANGIPSISFVNRHDKLIIAVGKEEYQTIGFDGSWESAYYLVSPALVRKLSLSGMPSPAANARWYEKNGKDDFFRVLWAEDMELPLVIESGTKNGVRHSKVTAKIVPLPQTGALPWVNLQNFEHKDYNDLLD